MTQFGFLATNNNSQVLISSKTKNLHFLGKAVFYSTLQTSDAWGGIRRWAFRIKCPTTPTPFFSVPTSDRYAISRMTLVTADTWEIEVIRSGTSSTIPEVYVFSEINSMTRPTNSYGFQVFTEDGSGTTFDSRLRPLIVKGGLSVMPPYDPLITLPSGLSGRDCSSNASANFAPNKISSSVAYNTNLTKPIVSYQTVTQTMRQVHAADSDDECIDFSFFGGCLGRYKYMYWDSYYWAFYRASVSAQQSGAHTYVNTGWTTISYGCVHSYDEQTSFGIRGVVGVEIGSDSNVAGTWPFTNLTINFNSVPLILSDGSLYD